MQDTAAQSAKTISQNKGEVVVSTGLYQIFIGVAVVLQHRGICGRVVTTVEKKRKKTVTRQLKIPTDIEEWLVDGMNRRDSFIYLMVMQPVMTGNFDAYPTEAFDASCDIMVKISSCVKPISKQPVKDNNRKTQHVQSHLSLQLYLLNLIPILPHLVSDNLHWNYSNLGDGIGAFHEFWNLFVKMTYWKCAVPIQNSQSNSNSNNIDKPAARRIFTHTNSNNNDDSDYSNLNTTVMNGCRAASKREMIEYKQKLSWSIVCYNWAIHEQGDKQLVPAIYTRVPFHPFTDPMSTSLSTYSTYSTTRRFGTSKKDQLRLQQIARFNATLIENGDHRLKTPAAHSEFNAHVENLMEQMHNNYNMVCLTDYDKAQMSQEFWKVDKMAKVAFKNDNESQAGVRFACDGVDYGFGWKYSHDKQIAL